MNEPPLHSITTQRMACQQPSGRRSPPPPTKTGMSQNIGCLNRIINGHLGKAVVEGRQEYSGKSGNVLGCIIYTATACLLVHHGPVCHAPIPLSPPPVLDIIFILDERCRHWCCRFSFFSLLCCCYAFARHTLFLLFLFAFISFAIMFFTSYTCCRLLLFML